MLLLLLLMMMMVFSKKIAIYVIMAYVTIDDGDIVSVAVQDDEREEEEDCNVFVVDDGVEPIPMGIPERYKQFVIGLQDTILSNAMQCDGNVLSLEGSELCFDCSDLFLVCCPPSPIIGTIFAERQTSWHSC